MLGGSFAIGSYLAGRLGVDIGQLPLARGVTEYSGKLAWKARVRLAVSTPKGVTSLRGPAVCKTEPSLLRGFFSPF